MIKQISVYEIRQMYNLYNKTRLWQDPATP